MARPGIGQAEKLLKQIRREFGVDLSELRGKGRSWDIVEAKEAYIVRARALRIPVKAMAQALGVSCVTISYRSCPIYRERCVLRMRRRRAAAKAATGATSEGF
jgi:hypothetical protein